MARLMNAIKMGYFPTPSNVIELISKWLVFDEPEGEEQIWRLLDPCAGKGEAAQLVNLVGGTAEAWGVELSPHRAEVASEAMDKVYNCGWRQTRVDKKSVSLLWLNPPYDHDLDDDNNKRLEIEFLRTATPTLVDGGVLVYIIPRRLLGFDGVARRLAGHFEGLVICRFPDGEYERFKQVVVLGVKKKYKTPTKDSVEAIRSLADDVAIPHLEAPKKGSEATPNRFVIPPAPKEARFRRVSVPRREQISRAYKAGWPDELLQAMEYKQTVDFHPVLPPKKGHIAMIMSSGVRGIMPLKKNGNQMLVKGRTVKVAVRRTETDEKGRDVVVTTYKPKSVVGTVSKEAVQVLDTTNDLTEFMEEYGDVLAEQILVNNQPLYDLDPPPATWEHLGRLSKNRDPLPGQKEPGLLPVQKHTAIAIKRAVEAWGSGLIQGEMGVGKTTVSLATIDLLDAYPAVVLCPPHMVDKWQREAREVIPGVHTRELARIGKTASMDHEVNDVREFLEDWKSGRLGDKAIAVVSSTAAKLGSGWEGAMATRYTLPAELLDEDGKRVPNRAPFREALKVYKRERKHLMTLLRGNEEGDVEKQRRLVRSLRRQVLETTIPYPVCPDCGKPYLKGSADTQVEARNFKLFEKKALACNRAMQGWARDEDGDLVTDEDGNPVWVWYPEGEGEFDEISATRNAPRCNAPLYQFGSRYRRYPIADYIFGQARNAFEMLVVDEIHHYKGKGSDRGVAFARMVDAIEKKIGLTGTLYGGKASDIYWLLYRLGIKNIQQAFDYNTARKWVEQYGVLEKREISKKGRTKYGAYNATRRSSSRVKEKPGVSPGILRYLIDNTVFLALKDLGIGLPPYKEEVVTLKMDPSQWQQWHEMDEHLKQLAVKDSRYLSTWLQRSLGRPNTGFRHEEIVKEFKEDGEVVREERLADLPPVVDVASGELLPKERWLAEYAQAEVEQGRKVLVYARQTGEYDIQPRLKRVLEDVGLKTRVLTRSVGTREREEWVAHNAPRTDVLIVNPRLVETGLDLVQFCTVVFYEISYSLFTMWQAMRRVWRLGQTEPVKVVFTAYERSMEARALGLMGQKMGAAQLLYGDEVGGAIVPEDTGDFLTALARNVLENEELPDLQAMFAEVQPTTDSPLGSPTAKSPRIRLTMLELARQLGVEPGDGNGRRRRSTKPQPGQVALPLFEQQGLAESLQADPKHVDVGQGKMF